MIVVLTAKLETYGISSDYHGLIRNTVERRDNQSEIRTPQMRTKRGDRFNNCGTVTVEESSKERL